MTECKLYCEDFCDALPNTVLVDENYLCRICHRLPGAHLSADTISDESDAFEPVGSSSTLNNNITGKRKNHNNIELSSYRQTGNDESSWSLGQEKPLHIKNFTLFDPSKTEDEYPNLLGSGSFGKVFHLRDIILQQDYAVKRISLNRLPSLEGVLDEGKILLSLQHPNIVRVYNCIFDKDKSRIEDSRYFFIVMELIKGFSLRDIIHKNHHIIGNVDVNEDIAMNWIRQSFEAIDYLHGRNILHRDLKPSNIMISLNGSHIDKSSTVKVIDLGLSVADNDSRSSNFAGTKKYASEEKLYRRGYDDRDDVWALGCIFLELALSYSSSMNDMINHLQQIRIWASEPPQKMEGFFSTISKAFPIISIFLPQILVLDASIRPNSRTALQIIDRNIIELREELYSPYVNFEDELKEYSNQFVDGCREWIFEKMEEFFKSNDQLQIISADAGMGKSTFIGKFVTKNRSKLLAMYFCKYGNEYRSNAVNMIKALSYQIAESCPSLRAQILLSWKHIKNQSYTDKTLLMSLIYDPLRSIHVDTRGKYEPYYIVIDALDEFGIEYHDKQEIVHIVLSLCDVLPYWVKLIITTRSEADIINSFTAHRRINIDNHDDNHMEDLRIYLETRLNSVPLVDKQGVINYALKSSDGRFVYVYLLVNEILKNPSNPSLSELPAGLDSVYLKNIRRIYNSDPHTFKRSILLDSPSAYRMDTDDEDINISSAIKRLLSALVVMHDPILFDTVQIILGMSSNTLNHLATLIQSFFPCYSSGKTRRFIYFHKSIVEWLLDKSKSSGFDIKPINEISYQFLSNLLIDRSEGKILEYVKILRDEEFYYLTEISGLNEHDWDRIRLPLGVKKVIQSYIEGVQNNTRQPIEIREYYDFSVNPIEANAMIADSLISLYESVDSEKIGPVSSPNQNSSVSTNSSTAMTYVYDHLISHLIEIRDLPRATKLLMSVKWLLKCLFHKTRHLDGIIDDVRKLASKSLSKTFESILRRIKLTIDEEKYQRRDNQSHATACMFVLELMGRIQSLNCLTGTDSAATTSNLKTLLDDCLIYWKQSHTMYPLRYQIPLSFQVDTQKIERHILVCHVAAGDTIILGNDDGTVSVLNSQLNPSEEWKAHDSEITCISTFANGRIVTGSIDGSVKVWYRHTHILCRHFAGHEEPVSDVVAFDQKNLVISSSDDKTVRIWDVDAFSSPLVISDMADIVSRLAIIDNEFLLCGLENGDILALNLLTMNEPMMKIGSHGSNLSMLVVFPNKTIVSGSSDNTVKLWNWDNKRVYRTIQIDRLDSGTNINIMNISHMDLDNSLSRLYVVCSLSNGSLYIYDIKGEKSIVPQPLGVHSLTSHGVLSDGKIVCACLDGTVCVWNPANLEAPIPKPSTTSLSSTVLSITRLKGDDARTSIAICTLTSIQIWNTDTGQCEQQHDRRDSRISAIVPWKTGHLFFVVDLTTVVLWNYKDNSFLMEFKDFYVVDSVLEISSTGNTNIQHLFGGGLDGTIHVRNLHSKHFDNFSISLHTNLLTCLKYSIADTSLYSASDGILARWNYHFNSKIPLTEACKVYINGCIHSIVDLNKFEKIVGFHNGRIAIVDTNLNIKLITNSLLDAKISDIVLLNTEIIIITYDNPRTYKFYKVDELLSIPTNQSTDKDVHSLSAGRRFQLMISDLVGNDSVLGHFACKIEQYLQDCKQQVTAIDGFNNSLVIGTIDGYVHIFHT